VAYGDRGDLAARACRLARRDPTDTTGDVARANDFLNDALLSILDDTSLWDFLEAEGTFSTVAGTDTYTYATIGTTTLVPTNGVPGEIISIVDDSNSFVLRPLSWEALERAVRSTQYAQQPQGAPQAFAKWDSRIRLFPEPDAVYTLRWFGRQGVAMLVNDSDIPPIPLAWRYRTLAHYAAAQLLRMESGFIADYEASSYEAQVQQAIQQMKIARGSAKRPAEGVQTPGYGRQWGPVDATEFGWIV